MRSNAAGSSGGRRRRRSRLRPGGRPGGGGRGAGTGRATAAFAARGIGIVAVEPDDAMADILTRRIAPFPGVRVVRSTFEAFRAEERFGLLFSAEAWHWTRPETRWALATDALAGDGAFALLFNNERIAEPVLRASMLRVIAEHAPSVTARDDEVPLTIDTTLLLARRGA